MFLLAAALGPRNAGFGSDFHQGTELEDEMNSRSTIGMLAAFLSFPLFAGVLAGQAPSPAPPQTAGKAAEAFKNVQVLKDVSRDQLIDAMRAMTEALGTSCEFCHVASPDGHLQMERDDKRAKQTARKMITLTEAINRESFEGRVEVGCATCHQGQPRPMAVPPVRALGVPPAAARPDQRPPQAQVPAAEVLARYRQQLGGPAIEKITARLVKGVLISESGASSPLEIQQKGPDKFLLTVQSPAGSVTQVLNGDHAWRAGAGEARDMHGVELERLRRQAEFFPAVDVLQKYPRVMVGGTEKVGEREAIVVQAMSPNGSRERLWFEQSTGLLLRRAVYHRTVVGIVPEEAEYRDYREVDGVKVPFEVVRREAGARWTERYSEVRNNVSVDDSKFEKR